MQNKHPQSCVFPAVIEGGQSNYSVYFPDLPGCVSSGRSMEEAIEEAREALSFHLWGMECDGEPIPSISGFESLQKETGPNEVVCYMDVNMSAIRSKMNHRPVKKRSPFPGT